MPCADDARRRFDDATAAHLTAPLGDGVTIRSCDAPGWKAVADPLWADDPRPPPPIGSLYPPEAAARLADLAAVQGEPLAHRLVFEHGGEPVGAYFGLQESFGRYFMASTVFRRDFQRRGLYRALLPRIVAACVDAGFVEIYSRHRADNNPILVPKLRQGFTIAGFEVSPRYGLLVHLRRYLIDGVDALFHYRFDGTGAATLRAAGMSLP